MPESLPAPSLKPAKLDLRPTRDCICDPVTVIPVTWGTGAVAYCDGCDPDEG